MAYPSHFIRMVRAPIYPIPSPGETDDFFSMRSLHPANPPHQALGAFSPSEPTSAECRLLPVPHTRNPSLPHLPLQLENTIHERLTRGRAPGYIHIHRHDPITPTHHTVAVVVVPAAIGARAHGDDPARLGHLIVNLPQGRGHLVGEGAGDNHDVGLTG